MQVNDSNFKQEVLDSGMPVLVDFWAEWCYPCKMIAPLIEEIAREYQGRIKVCKVNVDESRQTASNYGIMSIAHDYAIAKTSRGFAATDGRIIGCINVDP